MKITKKEKILLALVLGAAISTSAHAADSDIVTLEVTQGETYESRQTNSGTSDGYEGCTFTDITSSNAGAALYNTGSIGEITGSTFMKNWSWVYGGGAIYNWGATIESIFGCTFTLNKVDADAGGAICNDTGSNIKSIVGSTFIDNKAEYGGGAIANFDTIGNISYSVFWENKSDDDYGGAINNWDKIDSITNCIFVGNTAYGLPNDVYGGGGAIYNGLGWIEGDEEQEPSSYGTINSIEGSIFTSNEAKWGGAIYNSTYANIGSIEGSTFTGNIAKSNGTPETVNDLSYGGAIFNYNYASIDSIANCTFTGNSSEDGDGGAIYNYDGAYIGSITGSTFTENMAGQDGGAIYNFWETTSTFGDGIIGNIDNCTFTGNTSANYGGAIFTRGWIGLNEETDDDGEVSLIVTGGIYNSTFTGNTSGRGGAIYNGIQRDAYTSEDTFDSIITSIEGCTFEGNTATNFGGAIYNFDDGYIWNISDNRFLENKALNGNGGAIENAEAGSVIGTITHNYFYANDVSVSDHGGGAIYSEGIINSITENYFLENISGNYGGAFYNNGGTIGDEETGLCITGNIFQGNESGRGGAIYNTTNRDLTTGVEILDYDQPGIIYSITGNYFVGNIADNYGGAIYNYHYGFIGEIADNYFIENEADNGNGGAIENAEADAYIGAITNNYFYKNKISESIDHGGGAIYNEGNIASFGGNTFEENTSVTYGGAIYNNGGLFGGTYDLTIDDPDAEEIEGSISGNYFYANSSGRGGAIYNTDTRTLITTEVDSEGKATATAEILDLDGKIFDDDGNAINGTIKNINNNVFESNVSTHMGGAIYNYHGGEIGSISGNTFTGNEAQDGNGGAIENAEFDATIGDMVSNTFSGNTASGNGGAIYNQGTIGIQRGTSDENPDEVTGGISDSTFTGNTAANGGAIYNNYGTASVYILASANSTEETETIVGINVDNDGNITYTDYDVSLRTIEGAGAIGDITGSTFTSNTAVGTKVDEDTYTGDAKGGAIYNASGTVTDGDTVYTCTINSITDSTFTNNSAISADGAAMGGAIYNAGSIGTIELGDLYGNYAQGATSAAGGAIYSIGDGLDSVSITGDVTGNYATASSGDAMGGAIYISAGSSDASPASITPYSANDGTEVTITGDVIGNSAEGANAYGGAIYNDGGTVTLYGNIAGNYASATDEALGGAIYNAGTVNIIVEDQDAVITGNYANDEANVIYATADSVTNFTLTDASLLVEDSIEGETGYEVNVIGNGVAATTFYMYNDFLDSDLSFDNTTLSTINNEIKTYNVNKFTVAGDFNMVADVDLESETMDHFETTDGRASGGEGTYGEANGKLNVSGMNLTSDTEKERVAVYFAEPGLMIDVTSSVGELPGSDQQKAYTPLYSYDVHYVYKDGEEIHYGSDDPYAAGESALLGNSDDGGYFVFNNRDYNPAVMATSEAAAAAYGFMGLMFEYNFEHTDYYMKLPEDVRIAQQEAEEEARKEAQMAESDATKPAYYNRHELTETGAWMRAFNSNESVSYGSGWDSRDKYYGVMVGFDTKVHEHDNGWASVFTGYGGTMGIRQTYSGGHIKQHGMFIGATETFYKKNFYTAWTIAAGTAKAHEHTMYGHDKDRIDTYGVAGRIGYNIKLGDEGKFSLLPTFTASYTYVNPEDFTNAAGVKIDGSGLSAVQLNPNIKLLWNRDDGWTPYLTVGEVWTVAESSHIRADGHRLHELDFDPYTEYGIGVQKRWANERDAYVQVLGHSHGRDGILVNAGIRWNF